MWKSVVPESNIPTADVDYERSLKDLMENSKQIWHLLKLY
jgi:hypothetical protein